MSKGFFTAAGAHSEFREEALEINTESSGVVAIVVAPKFVPAVLAAIRPRRPLFHTVAVFAAVRVVEVIHQSTTPDPVS